eukprot:9247447-Alexandrium_andersonii.AAC.1
MTHLWASAAVTLSRARTSALSAVASRRRPAGSHARTRLGESGPPGYAGVSRHRPAGSHTRA